MIQSEERTLSVVDVAKETYLTFRTNLKQHAILSYVFYLPFSLFLFVPGLSLTKHVAPGGNVTFQFSSAYLAFVAMAFLVTSALTLLFFRLHLLGCGNFLKFSLPDLGRMLLKYILYLAAMIILLLIFMLVMTTGLGLVLSVISGVSGLDIAPQGNRPLSLMIATIITIITVGISFRMQITFVSIAENRSFIPFREAWYYSRNNSLTIFTSLLLSVLPAWVFSMLLLNLLAGFFGITGTAMIDPAFIIVQYMLSPLILAPSSLFCCCMTRIYTRLVRTEDDKGHIADLIV
ncbi:hypothetical protein [Emcibacter sp.]|uniref:hypothetical protein n=1 Tax=Emcibacter sp. TaxID=1979954 RepID=UPI003A8D9270